MLKKNNTKLSLKRVKLTKTYFDTHFYFQFYIFFW